MKRTSILVVLLFFLCSSASFARVIFQEDFNGYSQGWVPSKTSALWPCTKDIGGSCVAGGFSDFPLSSANPSTPEAGGNRTFDNSWNGWSKDALVEISIETSGGVNNSGCYRIEYDLSTSSAMPKANLQKALDSEYTELYIRQYFKYEQSGNSRWRWGGGSADTSVGNKWGRIFTGVDLLNLHANSKGTYNIQPDTYQALVYNIGNPDYRPGITPTWTILVGGVQILDGWSDEGGGVFSTSFEGASETLHRDGVNMKKGICGSLNIDEWCYDSGKYYIRFDPNPHTVSVHRNVNGENVLYGSYIAAESPSENPDVYISPLPDDNDQHRVCGRIWLDSDEDVGSRKGEFKFEQDWHCFEMHIKLSSSRTADDGLVEFWLDGVPSGPLSSQIHGTDFIYNDDRGGMSFLWLGDNVTYFDPDKPDHPFAYYIDNVVISTDRIGCGEIIEPPDDPQRLRIVN